MHVPAVSCAQARRKIDLQQNEYFTLNINGFYCFNSWFNCIDGFNNMFQLIIKILNKLT